MDNAPKVYVVYRCTGDYHPGRELVAVWFDRGQACEHADSLPRGDYEEVPLAPQCMPEED